MKRKKKLQLIESLIGTGQILRAYFTYDSAYYYYYPLAINDDFFIGQEEDDFQLDGYHIRRTSQLRKAEIKEDLCQTINQWNGVADQVHLIDIDISSWKHIFSCLKDIDGFVIIEDDIKERYAIGYIESVHKKHIVFRPFDAEGQWCDHFKIPYDSITHVAWNTRYTNNWYAYLKEQGKEKP